VVGGWLSALVVTRRTARAKTAAPARKSRTTKVFWNQSKSLGDTVV
jgi:hypothetical protein